MSEQHYGPSPAFLPALIYCELVAVTIEQRLADPLDLQQFVHRSEAAIFFAIGDDGFGLGFPDTSQGGLKGWRISGVQVQACTGLLGGDHRCRACHRFSARRRTERKGGAGDQGEEKVGQDGVAHRLRLLGRFQRQLFLSCL